MRVRSNRYQALARKRRERERCLAAERKRSHGELANRILGNGATVQTETLSYKAWQRQRYGKSTKVRSPAAFVNILRNKLTAAGGELIEFGTRQTFLKPPAVPKDVRAHPTRTRLVDERKGGFDFLGYRFEAGKRWPLSKSLKKFGETIRPKTKRTSG